MGPTGGQSGDIAPGGFDARDAAAEPAPGAGGYAGLPATDGGPPCTTDSVYLVVALGAGDGPYSLEAFHPATGSTTTLGRLVCSPIPGVGAQVNAAAVDRSGTVYAGYGMNWLVRVQPAPDGFECGPTIPIVGAYDGTGLAFVGGLGGGEELFVISDLLGARISTNPLGVIDLASGTVAYVNDGGGTSVVSGLTGTGNGRLFGMGATAPPGGSIVEIDPSTGSVTQTWPLPPTPFPSLFPSESAPLAYWAGDFYLFPWVSPASEPDAGSNGESAVMRFHPAAGTLQRVGSVDGQVFGAAVSTCAPLW